MESLILLPAKQFCDAHYVKIMAVECVGCEREGTLYKTSPTHMIETIMSAMNAINVFSMLSSCYAVISAVSQT